MNAFLRTGLWLGSAALAAGAAGAAVVWSGAYDVGADAPHTRPVYALLEYARERSIAARASGLSVPANLDDAERVRRGAGNYAAMCAGCHLTPGAGPSELSRGLYPAPPNLSQREVDAASAFWTIKHGIKASGMPAWGGSMDDAHLWDLVAFLGRLPSLDAQGYRDLVARSDGHSHGGGENMSGHDHGGEHDDSGGHGHSDAQAQADGVEAPAHAHAAKPHDDGDGPAHSHGDSANEAKPHDEAGTPAHEHEASAAAPTPSPAKARVQPPSTSPPKPAHGHADGQSHPH
ncbi:cytochrome c [Lysobacter sp. K5869]|uniref:c-type cytochrome n=1 Tax=Lysobacter sp. K5869 TaxID=2820808 RepID=UPI001C062161|nr:cytochrome c [Lysobacter sp. K5869]QWP75260.1 cytochrome c [Lysobacter sp. K5869]